MKDKKSKQFGCVSVYSFRQTQDGPFYLIDTFFEFSDFSIKDPYNSENEEYIKQQIRAKLDLVSVTLCLIGNSTYKSDWVVWEIEASARKRKGLVGVRLHSNTTDPIPSSLKNNGAIIVDWNHEEIAKAIRKAAR